MAASSKKAIYAALIGNGAIAVTKFIAAFTSGSSAMMSEGIHSLVDTGNQILLLYGLKRSVLPADKQFPLGHGKEVYFWSFMVAMLIFALGGVFSAYQGVQHILHPEPLTDLRLSYFVLSLAIVFEGWVLWVAVKEFAKSKGNKGIIEAVQTSKDPSLFVVVFEDTAALTGLVVAIVGLLLYQLTGNPLWDGIASVLIGVVLLVVAAWLAIETKGLLIGEAASPDVQAAIERVLGVDERISFVNEVTTLHMGPNAIIAMISVDFKDGLLSEDVEAAVTEMNRVIKAQDPAISRVFIEVEKIHDHHTQH